MKIRLSRLSLINGTISRVELDLRRSKAVQGCSTPPKNFGHLFQRSFKSVMAHRASAANARDPERFGGKHFKHALRHRLGETPATLLTRGYAALVSVTAERTTMSIDGRNFHDQVSLTFPESKLLTEGDLAVDAELIRRGAPLEKLVSSCRSCRFMNEKDFAIRSAAAFSTPPNADRRCIRYRRAYPAATTRQCLGLGDPRQSSFHTR